MPGTVATILLSAAIGTISGWIAHAFTNRREREKLLYSEFSTFLGNFATRCDALSERTTRLILELHTKDQRITDSERERLFEEYEDLFCYLREAQGFRKMECDESLQKAFLVWYSSMTDYPFSGSPPLDALNRDSDEIRARRAAHIDLRLTLRIIKNDAIDLVCRYPIERMVSKRVAAGTKRACKRVLGRTKAR